MAVCMSTVSCFMVGLQLRTNAVLWRTAWPVLISHGDSVGHAVTNASSVTVSAHSFLAESQESWSYRKRTLLLGPNRKKRTILSVSKENVE